MKLFIQEISRSFIASFYFSFHMIVGSLSVVTFGNDKANYLHYLS